MSNTTNDEQMRAALREKLEFLAQPIDGEGRDIGWWQTLAAMQQTEAKDCLSLLASQPVAAESTMGHVDLARKILTNLGYAVTPSREPCAEHRVERVAAIIAAAQTPAPGGKP